ncbi:MAG TPA: PSD1 and planctomycete cytochrome C domain-containing protein [Gemmataceae bacterium]|nr:PSD1 and planctomycete cytochrome C domain-containing protein [Gemmataceae bacterium]
MMYRSLLITAVLALGCMPLRAAETPAPARTVDFRRDIQPIFTRACLSCHDARKQRGGLRLDQAEAARRGGDSGAVIKPGDSAHSRLFLLISGRDPDLKMPPAGKPPLTAKEVALLRTWIDQGAKWPLTKSTEATRTESRHWAFQAVKRPALPMVKDRSWMRNALDAFVLARLEKEEVAPAPEADRPMLLRRLSLDLLGLPPSPEEIADFEDDRSSDAYEKVVDRLLASPHYGERWGRHWLDLARYADSDGYEKDTGRPGAWRYRHWVLDALNRNLPYDQFVIEQLAGDLLPGATTEQRVATGFHRNTLTNKEGGVDKEQFRVEAVIDRVNTTARALLGVTLGCAQCHDHKYDPFSQREYYRFFAFFNSDKEVDIPASLPGRGTTPTKAPVLALGPPRRTHILIRGDFLRKGIEVHPDTPSVLPLLQPQRVKTPTRLDLARWIARRDNPLTARVLVNWVWHKYFGRGIVPTLEDFGTQGERPSHPQLLDYLADDFMRRGWSLKTLHKTIVMSATYRQSSRVTRELRRRDPLNVLLARQTRLRLEAEVVRDVTLAASGLLTRTIGGPSVRPPQPPGISELTYAHSARWIESKGADRYRRGLYIWFQRTSPYPMLMVFDAPDSNVCCVRRERSNTPLQALTLLNDTVFVECARALGQRLTAREGDTEERIRYAFRLCLTREPTDSERSRLVRLFEELRIECRDKPQEVSRLAGTKESASPELAAWVALARTLLNLDEFVSRE